ncbi:pyridoxamine 5'-phosphate oxidase [Pseudomonadota bacterium]
MNSETLRRELMAKGLVRADLDADPVKQFEQWYAQTIETESAEPGAMSLATVDAQGQPWQRMVLLKLFDEKGFVFFTNYSSRKAAQIAANSRVSLLFPWQELGRQVKVTGTAEKIPTAESVGYFATRPRGSQIGAWASHQSKVIKSRAILDGMFDQMKHKFLDGEIPLPSFWGGYRVSPETVEFWQARDSRLHDRFIYRLNENAQWVIERLAP